jgi:hypothetical protein
MKKTDRKYSVTVFKQQFGDKKIKVQVYDSNTKYAHSRKREYNRHYIYGLHLALMLKYYYPIHIVFSKISCTFAYVICGHFCPNDDKTASFEDITKTLLLWDDLKVKC